MEDSVLSLQSSGAAEEAKEEAEEATTASPSSAGGFKSNGNGERTLSGIIEFGGNDGKENPGDVATANTVGQADRGTSRGCFCA
jgi:hypothetical protein